MMRWNECRPNLKRNLGLCCRCECMLRRKSNEAFCKPATVLCTVADVLFVRVWKAGVQGRRVSGES